MLKGYITYIGGLGLVLLGIYKLINGQTDAGIALVSGGIAVIGGRRAISEVESSIK